MSETIVVEPLLDGEDISKATDVYFLTCEDDQEHTAFTAQVTRSGMLLIRKVVTTTNLVSRRQDVQRDATARHSAIVKDVADLTTRPGRVQGQADEVEVQPQRARQLPSRS